MNDSFWSVFSADYDADVARCASPGCHVHCFGASYCTAFCRYNCPLLNLPHKYEPPKIYISIWVFYWFFALVYAISGGTRHAWLLPNLFADAGVLESFKYIKTLRDSACDRETELLTDCFSLDHFGRAKQMMILPRRRRSGSRSGRRRRRRSWLARRRFNERTMTDCKQKKGSPAK